MKMVRCLYGGGWIAMGRSRTKCPRCGATVGKTMGHPLKDA